MQAPRGLAALRSSILKASKETEMTKWRKPTVDEVYTPDEITARLADELPKWTFEDGWIRR